MNSNIQLWLDHPVTKTYLKMIKEHRDGHLNRILNLGVLTTDTLPELAQLKGQINALDILLDEEQLNHYLGEYITDE